MSFFQGIAGAEGSPGKDGLLGERVSKTIIPDSVICQTGSGYDAAQLGFICLNQLCMV